MTDTAVKELVARLQHATTTAANDDLSDPMTEKRARHTERIVAMAEAASMLTTLSEERDEARARVLELEKALEAERRTLDFIRRWAWRDGEHLSDTERLSSIKYHPMIKPRALEAGE